MPDVTTLVASSASSSLKTSNFYKDSSSSVDESRTSYSPPPPPATIDFAQIAQKWKLSPATIPYLKSIQTQQQQSSSKYNPQTELLAFFHPQKTGGTSLSDVLLESFQEDGVLPGSQRSMYFQTQAFRQAVATRPPNHPDHAQYWKNIKVLYSHSELRRGLVQQIQPTVLETIRNENPILAKKPTRLITLLREPVAWRASMYFEAMCHVGAWIRNYKQLHPEEFRGTDSQCPVVNNTDVGRFRLQRARNGCQEQTQKHEVVPKRCHVLHGMIRARLKAFYYCHTARQEARRDIHSPNVTHMLPSFVVRIIWPNHDRQAIVGFRDVPLSTVLGSNLYIIHCSLPVLYG